MQGVWAQRLWLGIRAALNPRTGIQCRVRDTSQPFHPAEGSRLGINQAQQGAARSWWRDREQNLCVTTPVCLALLGVLRQLHPGLLLSSRGKWGQRWSDENAAGGSELRI